MEDVDALLDAGIDVITTVNNPTPGAVNDVVEKITGIHQQETIPDAIVRRADRSRSSYLTPEALRRRMAHRQHLPADKDRRLVVKLFPPRQPQRACSELGTAGGWPIRVEDSLQRYLDDHAIDQTVGDRERLIAGSPPPRGRRSYCAGPRASRRAPGPNSSPCTL